MAQGGAPWARRRARARVSVGAVTVSRAPPRRGPSRWYRPAHSNSNSNAHRRGRSVGIPQNIEAAPQAGTRLPYLGIRPRITREHFRPVRQTPVSLRPWRRDGRAAGSASAGVSSSGSGSPAVGRGARRVPAEPDAAATVLFGRVRDRRGRQQRLRVRVLGRREQVGGRNLFEDAAEMHDGDAVGEVLDGGEVVRDERAAEAAVPLEVREEVEDGCVDRDVQRGGRLIGREQARVDREIRGTEVDREIRGIEAAGCGTNSLSRPTS